MNGCYLISMDMRIIAGGLDSNRVLNHTGTASPDNPASANTMRRQSKGHMAIDMSNHILMHPEDNYVVDSAASVTHSDIIVGKELIYMSISPSRDSHKSHPDNGIKFGLVNSWAHWNKADDQQMLNILTLFDARSQ